MDPDRNFGDPDTRDNFLITASGFVEFVARFYPILTIGGKHPNRGKEA
jgi:hypothetical protein